MKLKELERKQLNTLAEQYGFSEIQKEQLEKYLILLVQESEKINLTTITSVEGILSFHFNDSLMLSNFLNLPDIATICDVGTGGGFPGLPLKIAYPHLKLFLIEVNHKKIRFLERVIQELGLENVVISDLDWRTFLRKTDYPIDLFCARASLRPDELVRAFSPICPYNKATVVYWASRNWEPSEKIDPFIEKQELYKVGSKKRKFVFLQNR